MTRPFAKLVRETLSIQLDQFKDQKSHESLSYG